MMTAISETTPSLNYWYLVDPKEESFRSACWNVAYKTASVITFVAATALVSSVVIFSFLTASAAIIPSSLSITVAVAAMIGAPVTQGAIALWNKSKEYLIREKKEQRTEEWRAFLSRAYLNNDETLNLEKINRDELFQHFGISITEEGLTKIEQELPKDKKELKAGQAWIRVAARFMHELEITRVPDPEALESAPLQTSSEILTEFYQKHLNELWNKSKEYLVGEKKEQRTEEWRAFLSKAYLKNDETLDIEKINRDRLFQHFDISVTEESLTKIKQELPKDKKELKAGQAWICVAARFMHELETTKTPDPKALESAPLKHSPEILIVFYQKFLTEFYQKYLLEITQKPDSEALDSVPLKPSSEILTEFYQKNPNEFYQKKLNEIYQKYLNESYQKRGEFYQREYTYRQMHIFPRALNAVLFLAIMRQPFLKATRLTELGSLHIKPYIARHEDLTREGQDPYFISNKKDSKPIRVYKGPLSPVANKLVSVGTSTKKIEFTHEFKGKLQRLTDLLLGTALQINA